MAAPVSWDESDYEHLRAERLGGGIALLTLDLPERRNMMSEPMTLSWARAVAGLAEDPTVRVVVVTGAGSAFCSGGDLSWIGAELDASVDRQRARMMRFYRQWLAIRDLEVPTIAAINGAAIGAGLALALACDLRYAAVDARLAVPFTALGLHAGMATTFHLVEVVGAARARELLLTGRQVTGTEAAAMGLVHQAWPGERLLDDALGVARRIAEAAPIATRLTKAALRGERASTYEATLEWEGLAQSVTLATEDLHEGLRAARDKRPPSFSGR
jgi:enoyl-CoA hydratase